MNHRVRISLGILVLDLEQEPYYFLQLGKHSIKYNIEIILFTPSHVLIEQKSLDGFVFNTKQQKWDKRTGLQLPDIIYDRCFYHEGNSYKKHYPVIGWLRREVPFLGFGFPSKWEVHKHLEKSTLVRPFLIDTHRVVDISQIDSMLYQYQSILLKPLNGSQGKGIFSIELFEGTYKLSVQQHGSITQRTTRNKKALFRWLSKQISHYDYLCQPFLLLQDKDNHPFDLRILIQKNNQGEWMEQGRGIRIGEKQTIASNLHQGGSITDYHSWLSSYNSIHQNKIEKQIEKVVQHVPPVLEKAFPPLFEIGIDIGIDQNQNIWFLEANSKPGRKVLLANNKNNEDSIFRAPLEYIDYLRKEKLLDNYVTQQRR